MPRARKAANKGLPTGWSLEHGAYYYWVPKGLEALWDGKRRFRLGTTLPEAYKAWAERVDAGERATTIAHLLDRYALQVVPKKAAATRQANAGIIAQLRRVFGEMPLGAIKPVHVYKYIDKRSKKVKGEDGRVRGGKVAGLREIEVLSHAYTKAVEWGLVERHPFLRQVRIEGSTSSRDRYVEDWEVLECLSIDSRRKRGSVLAIQAYIRLKLLTGMARGDLLRLTAAHMRDDGIHVQRHKTAESTGKRTIYVWTPELRAAVDSARAARPVLSPFLFAKRDGTGYIDETTGRADGWDSMWQRYMDRVLRETKLTERFTEHDLRAKCASDADSLEKARALLAHADSRTTERFYRRRPERVTPGRQAG